MIVGLFLDALKGIRHILQSDYVEAHTMNNAIVSTMRLRKGQHVATSFFPNGVVERVGTVTKVEELERGLYVIEITYLAGDMRGCELHATSLADELWQVIAEPTASL